MVRSSSFKSNSSNNTRLYVVLGIFLIAIIAGTIIGTSYRNRELFSNSKKLVYLYMENCPHCKTFDKEWTAIETAVKNDKKMEDLILEKYNLNEPVGQKYAKDNNIEYAPAILFISSKTIEYNGNTRTSKDILDWVSKQSITIPTVTNTQ